MGKRIVNTFSGLFDTANIAFSEHHNARYGMPEFITMLTEMARLGKASEDTARQLAIGSPKPSAK